jgi:hypothetical protein
MNLSTVAMFRPMLKGLRTGRCATANRALATAAGVEGGRGAEREHGAGERERRWGRRRQLAAAASGTVAATIGE